jgi:MarR family transcriptional regulator, lower aerobic nicotinate degradation pathway regulator
MQPAAPPCAPTSHQSLVLIDHLARIARRRSELALAPMSLRPRHLVVLTILREHGTTTQSALCEALRLDPTNLVGLLNELEERSLLTRRRDPADRRRHIVELTDAGTATLAGAETALAAVQDEVLAGLEDEERAALHSLLARAAEGQVSCETCVEPLAGATDCEAADPTAC